MGFRFNRCIGEFYCSGSRLSCVLDVYTFAVCVLDIDSTSYQFEERKIERPFVDVDSNPVPLGLNVKIQAFDVQASGKQGPGTVPLNGQFLRF